MLKKKMVNITIVSLASLVLFGALLHGVAAIPPPYTAASGSTSMGSCSNGSGSINTYASNGQITANWSCSASSGTESGSGWLELFWTTTATTDWYVTTTVNFASMSMSVPCCGNSASWTMSFVVIDRTTGQGVLNQQFYSCVTNGWFGSSTNCNQGQTISYQSNSFFASSQHQIAYQVVVNGYGSGGGFQGSMNLYVTNMGAGALSGPCHHPVPAGSTAPSIAPSPNC